jgi:uracil-DNA glycosylase
VASKSSTSGAALNKLGKEAAACRNCELWERATQVVFGRGAPDAAIMLIGEQPGGAEDVAGVPFVGPAGRLLDEALALALIARADVYLTNAVKHFYWEERGKRRIHKKPRQSHVRACQPWLEAEIDAVKPRVLVCLGSIAAQAVVGPEVRVTSAADALLASRYGIKAIVTFHPSAILRAPDAEARKSGLARLVTDLKRSARIARRPPKATGRP